MHTFTRAVNPRDTITCPTCHAHDLLVTWQVFGNGTRHLRCSCRQCGRFLQYLPQTDGNVALVGDFASQGIAP